MGSVGSIANEGLGYPNTSSPGQMKSVPANENWFQVGNEREIDRPAKKHCVFSEFMKVPLREN